MMRVFHTTYQKMVLYNFYKGSYYTRDTKLNNLSTGNNVGTNEEFLKFCEVINNKLLKNEYKC